MYVNLFAAFTSGLISFFAPCVIPLLPAYIGYVTGVSLKELKQADGHRRYRRQLFISSLVYVIGFSLVFVILGTAAASLGLWLRRYTQWIQIIGGLVVMFFALNFLGIVKLRITQTEHRFKMPQWLDQLGYVRAFVVGVVFATAWTPCVGPVLGAILTLAATSATALSGATLLFVYSLGISIPFLIVSVFLTQAPTYLKRINRYVGHVDKAAGTLLLVLGFLLFNNHLKLISPVLTYDRLNGFFFSWETRLRYYFQDMSQPAVRSLSGSDAPNPSPDTSNLVVLIEDEFVIGEPAPVVEITDFDGQVIDISQQYGQKPIVLDFWAAWCKYCLLEMPELETISQEYGNDLLIIGVHRSETEYKRVAEQLAQDANVSYTLVQDDGSLYQATGGIGMPVAVFIDSDGVVRRIKNGPKSAELIRAEVEALVVDN